MKLLIDVTFDERAGYVASHPGLPPLSALSRSGLRRRIEDALLPETVEISFCSTAPPGSNGTRGARADQAGRAITPPGQGEAYGRDGRSSKGKGSQGRTG